MIIEYHIVSPRIKDQVFHGKLGCILGSLVVVAWDQVGPTSFKYRLPSCKLTVRHGKSTILMVFTRKDGDFHGRTVSFREGSEMQKQDVHSFVQGIVGCTPTNVPLWEIPI